MNMLRLVMVVAALLVVLPAVALAQEEPSGEATLPSPPSAVGERFTLVLEVETPPGAEVEVDPLSPAWDGIEVIEQRSASVSDAAGGRQLHRLELTVAAFLPGDRAVRPPVLVTVDGQVQARQLPAITITVPSSLDPSAPLELTEPAGPEPIGGAESPFLWPAIAMGSAIGAAVVLLAARWAWRRRPRRKPRELAPAPVAPPFAAPSLPANSELLRDPVGAYRAMSRAVREALATRYGLPALALTTNELARRMQQEQLDRWQTRLVTGLLENCDLVVYAGFRPPEERRSADLGMAREIMEGLA